MSYVQSLPQPPSGIPPELSPYAPIIPPEERLLLEQTDAELIAELARLHESHTGGYSPELNLAFQNAELAPMTRMRYTSAELKNIHAHLEDHGALTIPILRKGKVIIDGQPQALSLVAATEVDDDGASHGDMSSMVYLRDQIQVAAAFLNASNLNPKQYHTQRQIGREILLSALHLMSTEAQRERLKRAIELGPRATQADWPHISIHFHDLESRKPNGWRNIQDTLQMLACTTLEALENGSLDVQDLAQDHKEFLQGVPLLLKAAGFPHYKNSGSWEEVAAVRTSVMSIETALIHKMKQLYDTDSRFDFLAKDPHTFSTLLDTMLHDGLRALGNRIPDESPEYPPNSVKHRTADAALVYALRYNIPELLAQTQTPMKANNNQPMSLADIENLILKQIQVLTDPETHCLLRYQRDSYQRLSFHTNSVQYIITAIKKKVAHDARSSGIINLDEKQALRDTYTPHGPAAVWTHPLGQLGAWAAKRSRESKDTQQSEAYLELAFWMFNTCISAITSGNQYNAVLNDEGTYRIKRVPAYKLPECYTAYPHPNGGTFRVPSPHTPLNWSTAMLGETLAELHKTLDTKP